MRKGIDGSNPTVKTHRNYARVYDLFGSKLIMHSMSRYGRISITLTAACVSIVTFAFYTLKYIMVMLASTWTN